MTLRLLWGILPPCYGGVVWAVHNASTATSEPAMMASLGRMPSSRGLLHCHYVHDLISVIVITRGVSRVCAGVFSVCTLGVMARCCYSNMPSGKYFTLKLIIVDAFSFGGAAVLRPAINADLFGVRCHCVAVTESGAL